jgi:hypothetical protein
MRTVESRAHSTGVESRNIWTLRCCVDERLEESGGDGNVIDGLQWRLGVLGNRDRDSAMKADGGRADHAHPETVAEPDK